MCQAMEDRCLLPAGPLPRRSTSTVATAGKRTVRRIQMEREYTNLKHLLPSMNGKPSVSKVN